MQEALELIQAGGLLGFALLALGALTTGRVVPKHVVEDRDKTIQYERDQKDRAFALARTAQESHDRLADAVEARNRLDEARIAAKDGR